VKLRIFDRCRDVENLYKGDEKSSHLLINLTSRPKDFQAACFAENKEIYAMLYDFF
jgi:hypothetical protein